MSKKEEFISFLDTLLENNPTAVRNMSDNVKTYIEALKGGKSEDKPPFTDNGKLILKHMQHVCGTVPILRAKDIADGLNIQSRAVSGSIRKLVTDGYVEKVGQDPVIYALTEKGKNITID